ncbi:MAG: DUF6259 domain-containing protein [Spirochaetia bacterium]
MQFTYSRLGGVDIDATATARLAEQPGFVLWRFTVTNETTLAVHGVEFPVLVTPASLGDDASDDRILIPRNDGYLVGSPLAGPWFEEGGPVSHQRYHYPGDGREMPHGLSVQLNCFYDPAGGLYIATHDGRAHPKILGPAQRIERGVTALEFTPAHLFPAVPAKVHECSYDTVIGCFSGDWQDAAEIYKSWSVTEDWCRARVVDRTDIPEWLKRGAFFFNFRLRHQQGGLAAFAEMPVLLSQWQNAIGIPLVAMMCGWEKTGEWTSPDYFPPYGGDLFRKLCREFRLLGIHPFPFGLSGLKIALRKKLGMGSPQPELAIDFDGWAKFRSDFEPDAARLPGGELMLDSAVESWDGLHTYACIGTAQARRQLYDASLELVREYGARVVQADQLFNGASPECHAPWHGHPAGRGSWQSERLRAIYQEIRRDAKAEDADFVLSQEWQSEIFLQDLDVYHARSWDQRGLLGVPLFAFLYHEFLPCYGGDWSSFLPENTSGVHYHASNYVNGCLPAGCPQTMWREVINHPPRDADPAILTMARNASLAFVRDVRYLVLGKMLKMPPLEVPRVPVTFVGLDFYGWPKGTIQLPSVLGRRWQSPEGSVGYALANISSASQAFLLPVEIPGELDHMRVSLRRNGGESILIAENACLPLKVSISLNPQDAVLLEIEKSPNQISKS